MSPKRKSRTPRHQVLSGIECPIVIDFATYNEGKDTGIKMAAEFLEQFDKYVNHPWRLSDCLLAKFGLLSRRKVRRNSKKHIIVGVWNS